MGSVGAADIARGVGNGLGVVRTVRVIAVFRAILYESTLPVESPYIVMPMQSMLMLWASVRFNARDPLSLSSIFP